MNGQDIMANYMENKDYKYMDKFMNNMTDEEYKRMIIDK